MSRTAPSLQRLFVTGLLTLLPLWLTWVVASFIFNLLSDLSRPWVQPLLAQIAGGSADLAWLERPAARALLALTGTVLVILTVGWLANRVVGQRLIRWFERMLARVPLISSVYFGARKLLDTVQSSPDGTQRVVLVEFPHPGMHTVGLVTRTFMDATTGREVAAVYIPTTPNPTGGYLEIVPVETLIPTEWTVDQAMGFIISGGTVAPERLPFPSLAS